MIHIKKQEWRLEACELQSEATRYGRYDSRSLVFSKTYKHVRDALEDWEKCDIKKFWLSRMPRDANDKGFPSDIYCTIELVKYVNLIDPATYESRVVLEHEKYGIGDYWYDKRQAAMNE